MTIEIIRVTKNSIEAIHHWGTGYQILVFATDRQYQEFKANNMKE